MGKSFRRIEVTTRHGTFKVELRIAPGQKASLPEHQDHALTMAANRLGRSERRATVFKSRREQQVAKLAKVKPYGKRGGR